MLKMNVKSRCKIIAHQREAWYQVTNAWGSIMDCDDVKGF